MDDLSLARLAMAIDCEGGIYVGRNAVRSSTIYSLHVAVFNTNYVLIDWIRFVFESGSVFERTRNNCKTAYQIYWGSNKAAEILKPILPYLLLKREQAELGIEIQSTMRYAGGDRVPPDVNCKRNEIYLRIRELNQGYK